jgi:hypothetical protein
MTENKIFCHSCAYEIMSTDKYCSRCGTLKNKKMSQLEAWLMKKIFIFL